MPAPEHSLLLGRAAGRQSGSETVAKLNAALSMRYGDGQWVLYISALGLVFNKPLMAQKQVDGAALAEEARKVLLAEPGIAVAYTRAELDSGSRAGAPHFEQMRKTWNRDLSGDLQFALKPYWMIGSTSSMTTHGSPHPYDTNVPLLFYGPRWVKPGRIDTRVEIVDIAPTLAAMLDVPAPAASEGRVLPLKAPGS
jgi:arylsulfatase A-like enzyme